MDALIFRRVRTLAVVIAVAAIAGFVALSSGGRQTVPAAEAQQSCVENENFRCIQIVKFSSDGGGFFGFQVQANGTDSFGLFGDGDNIFFDFSNSPVVVTETDSAGYKLVDIVCHTSDNVLATVNLANRSVTLVLAVAAPVASNGPQPQDLDEFYGTETTSSAACAFFNVEPTRNNVGGSFPWLGNAAKKNQTAAANAAKAATTPAAAAGTLRPPSTGDAGLADDSRSLPLTAAILLVATLALPVGYMAVRRR